MIYLQPAPAGGEGDAAKEAAEAAAKKAATEAQKEKEEVQKAIRDFIVDKRILKNKILLFEEIIKYYKRVFDKDIIDSIKKSLKFLTKYNNRIDVLIDTYKHDDEGELNSTQIRNVNNKYENLYLKIFVNYFIDIISKYYDVSDMRVEIEELMHMLTFVEDIEEKNFYIAKK